MPERGTFYLKNPFPGIFHEPESQREREKQKNKDDQHTFVVERIKRKIRTGKEPAFQKEADAPERDHIVENEKAQEKKLPCIGLYA